jgi:Bax protein
MTRIVILVFAMLFPLFAQIQPKGLPQQEVIASDTDVKKQNFVKSLLPIIISENEQILKDRAFVQSFFKKYDSQYTEQKISKDEYLKLLATSEKYKISNPFDKSEYDQKIDAVPVSLALSQAVLESGWGESRIAKRANNLFGQKSFLSKKRVASLDGEVNYALFDGSMEAVKSYMLNLNSHEAYKEFRQKRATAKEQNNAFSGLSAAKTLKNYSEIGRDYTVMITTLIQNKFKKIDEVRSLYSLSIFDYKLLASIASF